VTRCRWGGSFRIATALKSLDETFFHDRHIVPQAGDFLLLTVTDSGHGMSPEILARIFDPYFTTKSRDKGTGLGLSMVYGIIKQLGGFIFCHSTPGVGTTFEIYLPLSTEDVEQSGLANRTQDTVSFRDKYRDLTVLVVDDEDALRGVVVAYLQSAGFSVHQASNGRAALDFIDGFAGKLDFIITDIMMPEMNGLDMAEEALLLQPETSVIFISGYSKELLMSRPNNQNFRLLVKPFSREALFAEIDLVLSTRYGSSFGGTSTGEYSI
jgi:two-component system cell cycle sensor histidine kinase/response regulator CckA